MFIDKNGSDLEAGSDSSAQPSFECWERAPKSYRDKRGLLVWCGPENPRER